MRKQEANKDKLGTKLSIPTPTKQKCEPRAASGSTPKFHQAKIWRNEGYFEHVGVLCAIVEDK